MWGKEKEREVDLNISFKKRINARSNVDVVTTCGGQAVTPIQSSPLRIHTTNYLIRPDMTWRR